MKKFTTVTFITIQKKVNIIVLDNARHFRNDISISTKGCNFELDREAENDLIALAKDIEYYLGDKYNY